MEDRMAAGLWVRRLAISFLILEELIAGDFQHTEKFGHLFHQFLLATN